MGKKYLMFDDCCFNESFQENSKCEGWHLVDLKSGSNSIDVTNVQDVEVEEAVIPDIGDYVAAVYFEDRKVYIGKVSALEETDAYVKFLKHNGNKITSSTIFRESK